MKIKVMKILRTKAAVQKEFARRDYLGLTSEEAELLKRKRSDYAKTLLKNYRGTMRDVDNFDFSSFDNVRTRGKVAAGGVETTYQVKTPTILGKAAHKNEIRSQMTKQIHEAGDIMREQVKNDASINHSGSKINKYAFDKDLSRKLKNPADKLPKTESINEVKSSGNRVAKWIKANPKMTRGLGIGAATVAASAAGYAAYKHHKNKKKKED